MSPSSDPISATTIAVTAIWGSNPNRSGATRDTSAPRSGDNPSAGAPSSGPNETSTRGVTDQYNAVPNTMPSNAQGELVRRRAKIQATAAVVRPSASEATGFGAVMSTRSCDVMVRTAMPSMNPATTGTGTKLTTDP